MQASHASSQTMWKQVYQDALFESDPRLLQPKLQAAQRLLKIAFSNYAPVVILTAGNFSN
jgi:hypothetical protein